MQLNKNDLKRSLSKPQIKLSGEEISKLNIINNNNVKYSQDDFDILSLIDSALHIETAKKDFFPNNFYTRDDLLLKTKANSVQNFLSSLQNKNISHLKNAFYSKINENALHALLKISEYKTMTKDNINKYEKISEENKKITKEISHMSQVQRKLGGELRKSQNIISKLQINDINLKKYKSLYDEFTKYYEGKDPINQMKELKINKNDFLTKFNEYNDLQRKLQIENKEDEKRLAQEKKILNNMHIKYNRVFESNNLKNLENQIVLEELKAEKNTLQKLKEDNNKYRTMLFNLYKKLLDAFKLNKKIKIDKKFLNLKEQDFCPEIMDDMDIFNYIKAMINNLNPSEKDKALKETIAYSNMITRIYLKNKNALRYDPLNTFKELKFIMERKEQKIAKLSDKVKDFEIRINNMELENKKLNNLLIHFNQERIKNSSNKSYLMAQRAMRRSTSISLKKSKIRNFGNINNLLNKKRPKTGFINSNLIKKYDNAKKNIKNINNKSSDVKDNFEGSSFNINKFDNIEIKNKISEKKYNKNYNSYNMVKLAKEKWKMENIPLKEFKKIKESKNQDKIIKVHNQQPLLKCINEFNRLIKHTNKLFVYKYRISPRKNSNNNGIQNMTNKYIASKALRKNKSMEEIKNNKTEIKIENNMSQNIENKINELINAMKNKKS